MSNTIVCSTCGSAELPKNVKLIKHPKNPRYVCKDPIKCNKNMLVNSHMEMKCEICGSLCSGENITIVGVNFQCTDKNKCTVIREENYQKQREKREMERREKKELVRCDKPDGELIELFAVYRDGNRHYYHPQGAKFYTSEIFDDYWCETKEETIKYIVSLLKTHESNNYDYTQIDKYNNVIMEKYGDE